MKAIVLAGERTKAAKEERRTPTAAPTTLTPVAGVPSLLRVVRALRGSASINGGLLAGPAAAGEERNSLLADLLASGDFEWMPPAAGPAESALAAAERLASWPMLLTTGDHALLSPEMIDEFCAAAADQASDLVVALVPHALVQARFPNMRRTRLRFSDGAHCGANLYFLANADALGAIALWRRLQAHRKRPWRIAEHLGWGALFRYAFGALPVDGAFQAVSKKAGCAVGWASLSNPLAAVDVDSQDDLAVAERILQCRPCS